MSGGTRRRTGRLGAGAACWALAWIAASGAGADPPAAPTRYAVTEIFSLLAPGQVLTIERDGDRAAEEQYIAPGVVSPQGSHSRAYYMLDKQVSYTLDLLDASMPCGPGRFTGDWGDPFVLSADLLAQLEKFHPTDGGAAVVNGLATRLREADTPDGRQQLYVEPVTGLIVKWVIKPPSDPPKTMIEVKALSLAPPPQAFLALPAKCAG